MTDQPGTIAAEAGAPRAGRRLALPRLFGARTGTAVPAEPTPGGRRGFGLRRARRSGPQPLSGAALTLYALAIAVSLGFVSAYLAVSRGFPLGALRVGPWTSYPKVGSREADPYARAVVARRGDIPLATGEGLAFTAVADSEGRPLDPACAYRLASPTPAARAWTLTIHDAATGRPVVSELGRAGFTSSEVLRERDGRFVIRLGREPQPGNWLRTPESDRYVLTLRLYDTPVAAGSAALDASALPAIGREGCR